MGWGDWRKPSWCCNECEPGLRSLLCHESHNIPVMEVDELAYPSCHVAGQNHKYWFWFAINLSYLKDLEYQKKCFQYPIRLKQSDLVKHTQWASESIRNTILCLPINSSLYFPINSSFKKTGTWNLWPSRYCSSSQYPWPLAMSVGADWSWSQQLLEGLRYSTL